MKSLSDGNIRYRVAEREFLLIEQLSKKVIMSDLTCGYHPHRQAVEKCERCHRMICLKDKMLHEKWVGDTENRHLVKMHVCPLCHHDFQIESRFKAKNATLQ
ncbi:MAG: hypothetical protein ACW99A_11395 [Candidatus Kariarchaeaceae archaeon]|jgi:hypothetical protein